jgi:hypothetical protein
MADENEASYPPLNHLKPIADNVWIVDGPLIRFGPAGLKMPFPTRMTIIRLSDGGLFVHSPTALPEELKAEVGSIGAVRFVIGPNRLHYAWIADWRAAFPDAEIWLAPRIREQAGDRIDFPAHDLDAAAACPWDEEIATLLIAGRYMSEAVFFHRASRTLLLTDLIENFEPQKLSFLQRLLTRVGAAQDPHGSMPRDMRLNYARDVLRTAVETMIGWNPERILLAHGRWYERDGAAELRRAFSWLLG